jgi:hypothetical protein
MHSQGSDSCNLSGCDARSNTFGNTQGVIHRCLDCMLVGQKLVYTLIMDTEPQSKQTDIIDLTGVETLTSTQLNFIKLVLCGSSISAAALAAGVSRRTGTTWMQPGHEVRVAYERAKAQYSASIFERLKRIQLATLDTLEACLSPDAPPTVRFHTAKFLYGVQFNSIGNPRHLPQDPDDCPQPRQPSKLEGMVGRSTFSTVHYEGLTDQEIAQVEEMLQHHQQSREARNAGDYSVTVDLCDLTVQEAEEFEALAGELEYRRLVRLGEATEEEVEKWREEDAEKRC